MSRYKSEQEVRTRAAKRLREDIPDELWDVVNEEDPQVICDACVGEEEQLNDLVRCLKRYINFGENWLRLHLDSAENMENITRPLAQEQSESRSKTKVEVKATDYEKQRSESLSEYLALIAGQEDQVRHFRKRILGDELLTQEQAHRFLGSPVTRFFPFQWFEELGVPPVTHTAKFKKEVWEKEKDRIYVDLDVFVDPPGVTCHLRRYDIFELPLEWREQRLAGFIHQPAGFILQIDSPTVEIPVEEGSVVGELHKISAELANRLCYPWNKDQAAWFVLTDEPPSTSALTVEFDTDANRVLNYATVTLKVEPWVPAETVSKVYSEVQREILGVKRKYRPLSERNIAVFRFVIEQWRSRSRKENTWRKMLERWNQQYPEGHKWHYKIGDKEQGLRAFQRDFRHRASPSILRTIYWAPRAGKQDAFDVKQCGIVDPMIGAPRTKLWRPIPKPRKVPFSLQR